MRSVYRFPKTLNALNTINEVFKQQGIALLWRQATVTEEDRHEKGQATSKAGLRRGNQRGHEERPGNRVRSRAILTEFCFGDIYTRNGLGPENPSYWLIGHANDP